MKQNTKTWWLCLLCCLLVVGQIYAQDTLVWHPLSPLPAAARLGSAYFQIDSDFYVVGGDDENQQCNKEVWRYHITTDSWIRLQDFPHSEICETTGFAINGKGYVCTGLDSTPTQARDCDTLTWEYDPTTDSWKKMHSYPGSVREEASLMVFDNEAYLGIGYGCSYSLRDLRDWWKFNPAQNTWTQVDTFIGAGLRFTASLVHDSIGCIIGGLSFNSNGSDSVWGYNFLQDKWFFRGNIPGGARIAPLTISFKDFSLVGYGVLYVPYTRLMDFYKYDPSLNTWDTLVSLNLPRGSAGSAGFTYGRQAFILGNIDTIGRFVSSLWTADASGLFPKEHVGSIPVTADEAIQVRIAPGRLLFQSPERGYMELYDPLGRLLLSQPIETGPNAIHTSEAAGQSVCFYVLHLRSGRQATGRVVLMGE